MSKYYWLIIILGIICIAGYFQNKVEVYAQEVTISENTAGPPTVSVCTLYAPLFYPYTEEEVDLMAAIVFYEAGNQDMYGKQLVADTILNRVDSDRFPNSISEVIDQKGQFHTARKAHKLSGNAPIECYGAVISQLEVRENYEVMYFGRGYGCGKRLFKYGDHCFSGL